MEAKSLYYKISLYVYLIDIRSNLLDFALVIFALRILFSESKSMTIRFQKDMLLFEESSASAKPVLVPPLEWRLPPILRDFLWWKLNILTVLLELGIYYRKYYNFQRIPISISHLYQTL